MFSAAERDDVRARLLDRARADDRLSAAAITGSSAVGGEDEWSDVDLSFGVADGVAVAEVVGDWTRLLERDLAAVHHWDLVSPTTTFRVFLLPGGLEVDLGFAPQEHFTSRGPRFRAVFGEFVVGETPAPPAAREEIGLGWHHVLHARACIERGKPWQAEWLINGVRDHVITLACTRLRLEPHFARGADRLPADVTTTIEPTLVQKLDATELRRALDAAANALLVEVRKHDPELAAQLEAVFADL